MSRIFVRHRIKLHTKFITLLISVSLIPLLIVSIVTLVRFQQTLQTDAEALGEQIAATAAAEIKTFMVSQFGVLENIAAIYHPDFPIRPEIAEGIVGVILLRNENFMDISVADKNGTEIARKNRLLVIGPEDLRDQGESDAFKTVRENGAYVGPVYLSSGRPYFDFGRIILDSDGAFAGAVFAQVDARVMPLVVANISRIVDSPGRVYIVNEKGVAIAHPDLSYVLAGRNLSSLPPVKSIQDKPREAVAPITYTNENGDRVLGSVHPMNIELFNLLTGETPSIDWFVIAEQPEASVYGEARKAAWFSILISLVAVAIATGAAIFFAGAIARPIEALHMAALQFGKGNLAYRARVETKDEIGDLAQSFNTTAGALEQTVASLKKEEEIVEAERDKLQLILAGITNAVVAVDKEQRIILFNKAAEILTGFPMDDVLGKPLGDIIRVFDGEQELAIGEYSPQGTLASEGPAFSKNGLRLKSVQGAEHFVNLISGRIQAGESINLGCVLTFQDITREFIMEKTKREFVSIAAHQLRTPLTGMSWTIEALLSGEKGELNPKQKELAEGGLDAIHRMLDLVNDLLDVSTIEEGRFGITLARQPLSNVLGRVLSTFEKAASKKGVVFVKNIPDILPPLDYDAGKIEIVLNNLIDNAIKYTPAGGTVKVGAKQEGDTVSLSIEDSGIGIPAEETERVFTKFFRSRRALSYHTDGSGLGLYVAKNIIEQHGGRIVFTSAENKGSVFTIVLPIPSPSSPPPAPETPAQNLA